MTATVLHGDCRTVLASLPANSFDSLVTDPPYGLSKEPDIAEVLRHWLAGDDYTHTGGGFMGKTWDSFVPGPATWREVYRVLKPGAYGLVFAGSRTQDLMSIALRLAGFEIRDSLRYWYEDEEPTTPEEARAAAQTGGGAAWLYGSGFPKSMDISKAVDSADASAKRLERKWVFVNWMRSTRVSVDALSDALAGVYKNKETCRTRASSFLYHAKQGPDIPTLSVFNSMAHLLPPPPDDIMELMRWRTVESENMKRREVVSTQSGSRLAVAPGQDNDRSDVSLDITAAHTEEAKQWEGWGTALKPAYEPIILIRKPMVGTVADNVLTHGVGGLNIDGCRVPRTDAPPGWPANILHDGCLDGEDFGRYFYCAKASKADRNAGCDDLPTATAGEVTGGRKEGSAALNCPRSGAGRTSGAANTHPTVKPTDLMRWCCRLVTPPGGVVLDPFTGSGSTGRGAVLEGFNFLAIELTDEYLPIARARIKEAQS